jgi:tRNA-dihydrouridine synthase B
LPFIVDEIHQVMLEHLHDLYAFYSDLTNMRVARKHISWYTKGLSGSAAFRHNMNTLQTIELQLQAINDFFAELRAKNDRLVYAEENELDQETQGTQELAA